MDGVNDWLKQTKLRATELSEAYRLKLKKLWGANLMFVVVRAVFSTGAAIFVTLKLKLHTDEAGGVERALLAP